MIWLAWRRQRVQVLVSLGVIAVFAALIALIAVSRSESGVDSSSTLEVLEEFALANGLILLPVVLGAFAGGPLFAREVSNGTHTFVLTQSVSRWRWWAWRLVIATVPITAALVGLSVLYDRMIASDGEVVTLFTPDFETRGTLLAAYFLLITAIGAGVGMFVKSSTGSMAITVAVYLVIALVMGGLARPHLVPPRYEEQAIKQVDGIVAIVAHHGTDGLEAASGFVDADGDPIPGLETECQSDYSCVRDHGAVAFYVEYQPSSRYWPLQWAETGVVVAIAVVMAGVGARRLRKWYP